MEALLAHFGISITDLFAGFSGGMVAALVGTGSKPTAGGVFTSVVIGALTANYLGPVAPAYIGLKPSTGSSFVIGLGGMPICKAVIAGLRRIRWESSEG
jgi:hypothetical protein